MVQVTESEAGGDQEPKKVLTVSFLSFVIFSIKLLTATVIDFLLIH